MKKIQINEPGIYCEFLLISSLVTESQLVLMHTGIFQEATEMFILNLFNLINV